MSDQEVLQDQIHCPNCKSTSWNCYNERSVRCYDQGGGFCGDRVIGYLKCGDCGQLWEDYSVDDQDENCFCEDD